jgi:hypothetical protein
MMYLADAASSTISGDITDSATSFTLANANLGSPNGLVEITVEPSSSTKYEKMYATVDGNGVSNVTRGVGGTAAVAHSSGAVVTYAFTKEMYDPLVTAARDGWVGLLPGMVSATSLTYTYVSSTQFKATGDWTAIISKGNKLKLTNTTTKYFYVEAMSFSSGETTFTVRGGSDYALANAAVSAVSFSKQEGPAGFPSVFNFAPAPTGFSSAPSPIVATFSVSGGTATVAVYASGDGTSNSTSKNWTLPFVPAAGSGSLATYLTTCKDNGTNAYGKHVIAYGGSTVTCYPNLTSGTWTASGSCNVYGDGISFTYPI